MSAPHFWHTVAGEYVQLLGTFDGPRMWCLHVVGSGGREWRCHPDHLRPLNTAAREQLAAFMAEVEG